MTKLFIERWLLLCSLTISEIYSSAVSRVCFPQACFLSITTEPCQNCAFVLHCLLQFSSKNDHASAFPVTQESKSCIKSSMFISVWHPTYKTCAYFGCQSSLFSLLQSELGKQSQNMQGIFLFFYFIPQCYFRVLYASIGWWPPFTC